MKKSKLIIVEGPQGVGKTTLTNWLREKIPYSNLYRLTGHNDKSLAGLDKSKKMYEELLKYVASISECGVNVIFDRIYTSEHLYCLLNYRDYDFTEVYSSLNESLSKCNYDIIFINLYLEDINIFEERLARGKVQHHNVKFCVENSVNQQNIYGKLIHEIGDKYLNIKVHDIKMDIPEEGRVEISKILEI